MTSHTAQTSNPIKREAQFFGAISENGCTAYPVAWSADSKKLAFKNECSRDFGFFDSIIVFDFDENEKKTVIHKNAEVLSVLSGGFYYKICPNFFSAFFNKEERMFFYDFSEGDSKIIKDEKEVAKNDDNRLFPTDYAKLLDEESYFQREHKDLIYYNKLMSSPDGSRVAFEKRLAYGPGDLFVATFKN